MSSHWLGMVAVWNRSIRLECSLCSWLSHCLQRVFFVLPHVPFPFESSVVKYQYYRTPLKSLYAAVRQDLEECERCISSTWLRNKNSQFKITFVHFSDIGRVSPLTQTGLPSFRNLFIYGRSLIVGRLFLMGNSDFISSAAVDHHFDNKMWNTGWAPPIRRNQRSLEAYVSPVISYITKATGGRLQTPQLWQTQTVVFLGDCHVSALS